MLFVIIKLFTMEFVVFPFLHSLDKVKCMYRNAQVGKRAVATDYHDKSYLILMKGPMPLTAILERRNFTYIYTIRVIDNI